jgi:hypothetical protein
LQQPVADRAGESGADERKREARQDR